MRLVVQPGTGTPLKEQRTAGRKADPDKQQKIAFARSIEGSLQDKANAVSEKFGKKHDKSTIQKWLKEPQQFDTNKGDENDDHAE